MDGPQAPSVTPPPQGLPPRRLAVLELRERDGRLAQIVDVTRWPLTLGRALDNDVVLADAHVAAHHARIVLDAQGVPMLQALPSRNGVVIEHAAGVRRLSDGEQAALAQPARARLGHTVLRLRLPEQLPVPLQARL